MSQIHSTAIVSSQAKISDDVSIGPFSVISGKVKIGKGTKIGAHVHIGNPYGTVKIGKNNQLFTNSIVGSEPQDLSYHQEDTQLIVGDNNIIREFANINTGTLKDNKTTRIGNNCLIMVSVHIAHDCQLGDHIVLGNQSGLAGHVKIENAVVLAPFSSVVQFRKIGKHAYIIPYSVVNRDVLPFSISSGSPAKLRVINKVGLERSKYSVKEIANIKKALFYFLKKSLTVSEAVEQIQTNCEDSSSIRYLLKFIADSKYGLAK